jgi:hypothetical protein
MKLSRASGFYPECLVLKGVHIEGHPVAGDGYGDVYMVLLQGKQIAVKVLRIYQDLDLVKLLKVTPIGMLSYLISAISLGILIRGCLMAAAISPQRLAFLRRLPSGKKKSAGFA